jgi:hypothetical protein
MKRANKFLFADLALRSLKLIPLIINELETLTNSTYCQPLVTLFFRCYNLGYGRENNEYSKN